MGYVTQEHFKAFSRHFASYFKGKARTVEIDDIPCKYLEIAPEGKETIVFLHGLGSNKSLWRSQMLGYCNDDFRRISVDIPGASLSQYFDNKKHTISELARWLEKFIDKLGLGEVHLVTHSSISLLGIFFASSRAKKIKTLSMLALPDIWSSNALLPNGPIDQFRKQIEFETVEDAISLFNSMFYEPPKLPKALHTLSYNQQKAHQEKLLGVVDDFIESIPLLMAHTRKITCPVLIMNGEHDPYSSPTFINSLHWHFPKAQVISFAKSGHVPMLEQPVEVIGLHNEFVRNHFVRDLNGQHNIIHSSYSNA